MDQFVLKQRHFQDAITAQSACNLSGVVHSFSEIISEIWNEAHERGEGTEWVNHHPICILFADKIASLVRPDQGLIYSEASEFCRRRAEDPELIDIEEV